MTSSNFFRVSGLFLTLNLAMACVDGFASEQGECHSLPLKPVAVRSADAAIAVAKKITQNYKLTSLANECLNFEASTPTQKSEYVINVREKHSEQCGGDPMVEPRLFSFRVSKNGKLATDAYSAAMEFEPLSCRKRVLGH